jgi:hypothetical protein
VVIDIKTVTFEVAELEEIVVFGVVHFAHVVSLELHVLLDIYQHVALS